MAKKYVYFFGAGAAEGNMKMKDILGGKGANLAEMAGIGLPVPPGFTISTEVCALYYKNRQKVPESVRLEVEKNLKKLEKAVGQAFGDPKSPLLVSVRSGARASMPGMMDTILNLGLNDRTAAALVAKTGNERFVYDSYRRFVQMYGDVVLGLKPVHKDDIDPFEEIIDEKKKARGIKADTDLTAADLKDLVARFKAAIKEKTGQEFPDDPRKQLWGAIGAVFGSWMNDRAIAYRKMYDIPEAWGTAVNVQLMVFGNMGNDSGTGVAFTRDAATGENVFYGEYLMNAQGEDVVAGTRTPKPIVELKKDDAKAYAQLEKIRHALEKHYTDMMDIEFTIQQGKLYMLQCRVGKRTAFAAIKIAVDMVGEKLISEKEALTRIEPDQLNQLLRPIFDHAEKDAAVKGGRLLAKGLNAGPGAATGRVVFNSVDAEAWAKRGEKVILTRIETSPEDIKGMAAAEGILTARGGMTSHAALVARQMGRVCVAGCGDLLVDYAAHTMTVKGRTVKEGDWISIDGTTGQVLEGKVNTKPSEVLQVLIEKTLAPAKAPVYQTFAKVMAWADKYRTLKIRTNADQPDQSANAVAFGAEGIGLCRTEHMFFGEGKIGPMREMILADTVEQRKAALAKLLPLQRQDFAGIFEVMAGRPGDHPHHRPAAPRVPAPRGEGPAGDRRRDGHLVREGQGAGRIPPRVQSHARIARLPPGHHLSRDHGNAGPGHLRGRRRDEEEKDPGPARGHDPARRPRQGAGQPGEDRPGHGRGGHEGAGHQVRLPRRDHDRDPARRHHRRRDRDRGRVLQLRHERPDPDDARRQPRRRRQLPHPLRREGDLRQGPVRGPRPRRRRRSSCAWPSTGAARRGPGSSWASAASTAASRPRSSSATSSG